MSLNPLLRSIRWRWLAFATLAAGVLGGCVGLDTQQRKWIFQAYTVPARELMQTDDMQDVWIEHVSASSGHPVKLHGLWQANANPAAPLLLYLHGAHRTVDGSGFRIRHLLDLGFSVLAIDYRGFGMSSDELPSEALVAEDARAAWDWLGRRHPGRDRYLFGHSLGGAIAVRLAADMADAADAQRPKGLIVEGTFTSIPAVFQSFKWGWLPITALITQRFDSADIIAKVKTPLLVVHGSRDSLIPPQLGQALFERATAKKRFVLVEGGTHWSTTGYGLAQYREALHDLFGLAS